MELRGLVLRDRYRIYEQDGAAGMATVCLARDVMTSSVVTLLVLEPPITRDAGSVRRFMRSAEMGARSKHPYVAPVDDYGQEKGICYIVTRYAQQATLRDVERRAGALPVVQCAWFAACIASALEAGVRNGIAFHGALRPGNVIVTASGDAQVAGFGIAPASGALDEVLGASAVQYAAPEQLEGRVIDVRTDLYALGVMFYEMLTGHVPTVSDTHSFLEPEDVAGTSDRMDRFLGDIPARLRPVLSGLLAWDPDTRFSSPGDLIEMLVAAGFPAPQRPVFEPEGPGREHGPTFDFVSIEDAPAQTVSMVAMSELYVHEKSGMRPRTEEPASTAGEVSRSEVPKPEEGKAWETNTAPDAALSIRDALPVKDRARRQAIPLVALTLVAAVVYVVTAGWLSGSGLSPGDTTRPPAGQTISTGNLDVTSTPSGASIIVDGKSVAARTPATVTGLSPGSHTILLRLSGYMDAQQTVSVTAGNTSSVQSDLTTKPQTTTPLQTQATLRITSSPASASITLDGKATGRITPATLEVEAGSHTVSLSLTGYRVLSRNVDVTEGQRAAIALVLTRPLSAAVGQLRVASAPAGATVKIDGKAVAGKTPLTASVSVGSHSVQVSLQGYETYSQLDVDVVNGIQTTVTMELTAIPDDKNFVSTTGGFVFRYPETWVVVENPDPADSLVHADVWSPFGASVRISVLPAGQDTVQSCMERLDRELAAAGWTVLSAGFRTVGTVVYEQLVAVRGSARTDYCMIASGSKIFRIACIAATDQRAAAMSGFQVILGSFFAAP